MFMFMFCINYLLTLRPVCGFKVSIRLFVIKGVTWKETNIV